MKNLITSALIRLVFRLCFILSLSICWRIQTAGGGDVPSIEGFKRDSHTANSATPSQPKKPSLQRSSAHKVYMKNGVLLDCDYVWQEEWNVYCAREGQIYSLFVDDIDMSKTMKK